MADLEADVDDPDAMNNWDDEGDSNGSVADANEALAVDGASHEAAHQALDEEDSALATATTRQLSVLSGIDPPPESAEYAGVDAPPPSRSALSPTADRGTSSPALPSLLHRRTGHRITPPRHVPLPSTDENIAVTNLGARDVLNAYLRPITPTQSLFGNGDHLNRDTIMGDGLTPGSELGPMTPTNNAGPFVFDGSAGRDTSSNTGPFAFEGSAGRDSVHQPAATPPERPSHVTSEASR